MTYLEQLLDDQWKEKRELIITRDSLKCQECYNESYKDKFSHGLIYSNELNTGTSKITFYKNKFIVTVWDFKNNRVGTVFTNHHDFLPNKSYIAIYKKGERYNQLLALKLVDKNKVKLDQSYNEKIARAVVFGKIEEIQFKWRITAETYDEIYRKERKEDHWKFVKGLHVHHKYYQKGLYAWEYPNNALITLCWDCHEKLHKEIDVPKLDSNGKEIGKLKTCIRCAGAGYFPEYVHVESGICFRCQGAKYEDLI